MPQLKSTRLMRWQLWLLIVSGTALWCTGVIWLLLHYYGKVDGEFGVEENPANAWMLRAHGLAMLPALMGFGGLFVAHMPQGWKDRRRRNIGILLTVIIAVLISTGYMLYYVGSDWGRELSSLVHWALGLALPVIFIWHYAQRTARNRK